MSFLQGFISSSVFSLKDRVVIFIITITILLLSFFISFSLIVNGLEKTFYNQTSKVISDKVSEKFTSTDALLTSLTAITKVNEQLDRNSFYVMTNELIKNYDFIKNVAYFEKVLSKDKAQFEESMNEEFFYNYTVRSSNHNNDFLLPLKFIEPNTPTSSKYYGKDIFINKNIHSKIKKNIQLGTTQLLQKSGYFQYDDLSFIRSNYYGFTTPLSKEDKLKQFNALFIVSLDQKKLIKLLSDEYSDIIISFSPSTSSHITNKLFTFQDKKVFEQYGVTLYIYQPIMLSKLDIILVVFSMITSLLLWVLLLFNIYKHKQILMIQKHNIKQEKLLQQQSRLAQMGEMISMIAHQWRQPLSAISSKTIHIQTKLQLNKFDLEDKEQREKFLHLLNDNLDAISEYVQNLTITIDDFRNFFKPGKEKEVIELTKPIENSLKIVKNSLSSKNIVLEVNYACNEKVEIYPNEMMQVILNLLKNAEDNFIEKNISNGKINIETLEDDNHYFIVVCDNGGGIPSDILPKIFDPYFSTKHEKNGTGIGLYMSKIMIEEHNNGTLEAFNENEGVTFKISLQK